MEKNADLKFNISATANQSITSNIRFSTQDEGSAKLTFFLFKDGVELPLNAVVGKLVMRMRDGSKFTDNVSIIDKVNGIAEYKLTAEQLKHYGKVTAELYLYYEEQKLSVHRFTFTILQALIDEDIPVLTEFYIDDFEELKATINSIADETTEIINTVGINVEEAKGKADEAITLIEQNQVVKLTEFNENKQQVTAQLATKADRDSIQDIIIRSKKGKLDDNSRLIIESYQKQESENNYNGGEVAWLDLRNSLAKAMFTWRLPVQKNGDGTYTVPDGNFEDDQATSDLYMRRAVWMGAHWYAQDQLDDNNPGARYEDTHMHWSIEVPQPKENTPLQSRFMIPFGQQDTKTFGVWKSYIATSQADLTVRVTDPQADEEFPRLRVAGGHSNPKILEFNVSAALDDRTVIPYKRAHLVLEGRESPAPEGNNMFYGSDLWLKRFNNIGEELTPWAFFDRRNGTIAFGANKSDMPSAGDNTPNQGMAQILNIWDSAGRHGFLAKPKVGLTGGAAYAAELQDLTSSLIRSKQKDDTGWRFVTLANGQLEWGNASSATRDTTLYRAGSAALETNAQFRSRGGFWVQRASNGTALFAEHQGLDDFSIMLGIVSENQKRFAIRANGKIEWGNGEVANRDTSLYRAGSAWLKTESDLEITDYNKGFILTSQDGKRHRIKVNNDSTLYAEAI